MRLTGRLLIFLLLISGCSTAAEVVPMPPEMVGTWTTDDVRYEGRFFELTQTTLVIGTGEGTATSYSISALRLLRDDEGKEVHRVDYVGPDATHSMSFYFSTTEPGETLRMRNQPTIVWRRSRG